MGGRRITVAEVSTRLDTLETGVASVVETVETVALDVKHVKGWMEKAGLNNGTAETFGVVLRKGSESLQRQEINRRFVEQNLGWIRPRAKWLFLTVGAGLIASLTFAIFNR